MGTLYLRNVSGEVLKKLRVRAGTERRSVAQEALRILEEALAADRGPSPRFRAVLARLRRHQERARRSDRGRPSTEDLVREDRDR